VLDFDAGVDAAGWDLADFERVGHEHGHLHDPRERFPARRVMRDDGDAFSIRMA
jgi:hypothetical protein